MQNKIHHATSLALTLAVAVLPSLAAADGLATSAGDWLWPRVQARLTLNTATLTPVSLLRSSEATSRTVLGGALLGDYVLASPGFGSLRATSGLMLGPSGGAPAASLSPSPRLSFTSTDTTYPSSSAAHGEPQQATPYLGLGYNTPLAWRSLSLSADLGLVAERPSGIPGFGRALFGSGGLDAAWREMRVAPMVQLSVRYSF